MQEVNEVGEKVRDLRNRVAEFLLVIAKFMKDKDETRVARSSGDIMEELKELKMFVPSVHHCSELTSNEIDALLLSTIASEISARRTEF